MSLLWSGSLHVLGTPLRAYFLQCSEDISAVRNIGFGSKEINIGSFGLLLITFQVTLILVILIPLTLGAAFYLTEFYFPHVGNRDKITLFTELLQGLKRYIQNSLHISIHRNNYCYYTGE